MGSSYRWRKLVNALMFSLTGVCALVTVSALIFILGYLVYHGGRNIFQNPYAAADDSRFAMDFVYLKNGQLFTGAGGVGSKAEDYYCFGQPILAPVTEGYLPPGG